MDKENAQRETTVARQNAQKQAVLEQLRHVPVIEVACQKAKVSRTGFYRMRDADADFKAAVQEAIAEGVAFITDMSESQLIQLIKERHFSAIALWLRANHPRFSTKLEVNATVKSDVETLTPEQQALVDRALKLASLVDEDETTDGNEQVNREEPHDDD